MSPAALSQNSHELAQERLLDVTYQLVDRGGWDALRMTHVAKAAGVSRQTAYNEFGSKVGLGRALIEREIARFLVAVQEQVAPCGDDPVAAVEAGVLFTLRQAKANWLLKSIICAGRSGTNDVVSMATSEAEPLLPDAIAALRGYAAGGTRGDRRAAVRAGRPHSSVGSSDIRFTQFLQLTSI